MSDGEGGTSRLSEVDADDVEALPSANREEILQLLEEGVREAHKKAVNGRVYDAENERVRQGWLQRLGYLAKQYNQILNSRDDERFEELEAEVDALAAEIRGEQSPDVRADGGSSGHDGGDP